MAAEGDAGFSRRQPVRTARVPGDGVTKAPKPRKPRKPKGSAPAARSAPAKRAAPAKQRAAPAKKAGAPAKQRTAPAKKAGAPAKQRTAPAKKRTTSPTTATQATGSAAASSPPQPKGLTGYLVRPDTSGPKVRLGILWFLVAVGALVMGRWAVIALWSGVAGTAAWQVATAWRATPKGAELPSWGTSAAAGAAVVCTAAAGLGTGLGGIALILAPLALVVAVAATGRAAGDAAPAVIGAVLATLPAMSVVLVARSEQWAALFLVVAVSFFDAGNYIGAAESSSRLEGPVTGGIGLLAVTFAASAFEAAPFDRVTAWIAGAVMVLACPLGQMLVSAELPGPTVRVPAMRRLDAYLLAGPLMFAAVWAMG